MGRCRSSRLAKDRRGARGRSSPSSRTRSPGSTASVPGSVFWDVGANVGVYTLYAARRGDTRVVAFEPAAVNYFVLSANCEINAFDDRVTCLLMGLGQGKCIAQLDVSQFEPGLSFSFKGKRGHPSSGRQAALIMSMDQAGGRAWARVSQLHQDRRARPDRRDRGRRHADCFAIPPCASCTSSAASRARAAAASWRCCTRWASRPSATPQQGGGGDITFARSFEPA